MTDQVLIDAMAVAPTRINDTSPLGLYLSADLGFKRIWVAGDPKHLIYVDHDFRAYPMVEAENTWGMFVGAVDVAVESPGFTFNDGRSRAGQLAYANGSIHLVALSSRDGFGYRKIELGRYEDDPTIRQAVYCDKWTLLCRDIHGKKRPVFVAGSEASQDG